MAYDLRPLVRSVNKKEVAKIFDEEEYTTNTVFKRFYQDGCEVVRGIFLSKRKLTKEELADQSLKEEYCFYNSNGRGDLDNNGSNNSNDFFNRENNMALHALINSNRNNNGNSIQNISDSNDLSIAQYVNNIPTNNNNPIKLTFSKLLYMTLIVCLILFLLDLCHYFTDLQGEHEIEREKCIAEYNQNECDEVTVNDGPILNDFCKEKAKCKNVTFSNVYFHSILTRFIKDFFGNLFGSVIMLSMKSLISLLAGMFTVILVMKLISK